VCSKTIIIIVIINIIDNFLLLLYIGFNVVSNRPSYALQNIRKKIENENPHVAKFALLVIVTFELCSR